jgi:hypothetical protein
MGPLKRYEVRRYPQLLSRRGQGVARRSLPTVQFSVIGASSGTIAYTGVPQRSRRRLFKDQSFFEQLARSLPFRCKCVAPPFGLTPRLCALDNNPMRTLASAVRYGDLALEFSFESVALACSGNICNGVEVARREKHPLIP